MKPYSKYCTCIKCGTTDYHASRYIANITGAISDYKRILVEYILRTCNNCGYEWKEKTLDNKEIENG